MAAGAQPENNSLTDRCHCQHQINYNGTGRWEQGSAPCLDLGFVVESEQKKKILSWCLISPLSGQGQVPSQNRPAAHHRLLLYACRFLQIWGEIKKEAADLWRRLGWDDAWSETKQVFLYSFSEQNIPKATSSHPRRILTEEWCQTGLRFFCGFWVSFHFYSTHFACFWSLVCDLENDCFPPLNSVLMS